MELELRYYTILRKDPRQVIVAYRQMVDEYPEVVLRDYKFERRDDPNVWFKWEKL